MSKYNIKAKKEKNPEYLTLHSVEYVERVYSQILQKLLIEKKYRDKEYSASSLSKEIGVNTRCLSSVINLRYRDNFSQMVNDMRIREAQYMLSDRHFSDMNVEDIGAEVGYLTRQSFYTAFYKRTHMTPKEYRKQYYKE